MSRRLGASGGRADPRRRPGTLAERGANEAPRIPAEVVDAPRASVAHGRRKRLGADFDKVVS